MGLVALGSLTFLGRDLGRAASGDTVADRVFGEPDFTSNLCNGGVPVGPISSSSLCLPEDVAVDATGTFTWPTVVAKTIGYWSITLRSS